MSQPDLTRVPEFYHNYIKLVPENDLFNAFKNHSLECINFIESLSEEKINYRYAEGKWTIKEIVQHIIDVERIFSYRALCFARKETKSLPGFDENVYADHSKAGNRKWNDLVEEFKTVRRSSELLFFSFDDEQLNAEGISNEHSTYVLGIGYILIGHCLHHVNVIKERYLN